MTTHTRCLLSALAIALCACDGASVSTNDAGPVPTDAPTTVPDALFGSWFAQITVSDNQTQTLTLRPDRTFSSVHSQDNGASQDFAGCTEQIEDAGTFVTGTAAGMPTLGLTVNGAESGRVTRTGCDDPADDGTSTTTPLFPNVLWTYTLAGDTLTLHDASGDLVLTRQ
jgi:hypothetical protein